MKNTTSKLFGSTSGAALIEYATLLGLIGVVAILSVSELGEKVSGIFETADADLNGYVDGATTPPSGPATGPVTNAIPDLYPTGVDCDPARVDGTYDPSFTCFYVNPSYETYLDFDGLEEDLVFRVEGPATEIHNGLQTVKPGRKPGDFGLGAARDSTLIFDVDGGTYDEATGTGTYAEAEYIVSSGVDVIFAPNKTCSDARFFDLDRSDDTAPRSSSIRIDFTDQSRVVTSTDLDFLICGRDNVTLDMDDINAIIDSPPGTPFPEGTPLWSSDGRPDNAPPHEPQTDDWYDDGPLTLRNTVNEDTWELEYDIEGYLPRLPYHLVWKEVSKSYNGDTEWCVAYSYASWALDIGPDEIDRYDLLGTVCIDDPSGIHGLDETLPQLNG
jgi:Flp pilus assembly pilin Flp